MKPCAEARPVEAVGPGKKSEDEAVGHRSPCLWEAEPEGGMGWGQGQRWFFEHQ